MHGPAPRWLTGAIILDRSNPSSRFRYLYLVNLVDPLSAFRIEIQG